MTRLDMCAVPRTKQGDGIISDFALLIDLKRELSTAVDRLDFAYSRRLLRWKSDLQLNGLRLGANVIGAGAVHGRRQGSARDSRNVISESTIVIPLPLRVTPTHLASPAILSR